MMMQKFCALVARTELCSKTFQHWVFERLDIVCLIAVIGTHVALYCMTCRKSELEKRLTALDGIEYSIAFPL